MTIKSYSKTVDEKRAVVLKAIQRIGKEAWDELTEAFGEYNDAADVFVSMLKDKASPGFLQSGFKVTKGSTDTSYAPEKLPMELLQHPGVITTFNHALVSELVTQNPAYAPFAGAVASAFTQEINAPRVHRPKNLDAKKMRVLGDEAFNG
jgi:hypothetical protein